MGIGSFFAALFQKEEDGPKEIKAMDLAPEHKARESVKAEGSSVSRKKEISSASKVAARPSEETAKAEDQKKDRAVSKEKEDVSGRVKAGAPGRDKEKVTGKKKESAGGRNKKNAQGQEKATVEAPVKQALDPVKKAKKDLYQYLNQVMRILYQADQEESWDDISALESPSDSIKEALDQIEKDLPENLWKLTLPFVEESNLLEPVGLKEAFYAMLLPFYPLYRSYFNEFKFNTFLNRDALELFRRLTGRKFRLGYRNRYADGPNAFEWKGEAYRVYDRNGTLLCDAVFSDGLVKEGYAVLPEEKSDDPDWSLRRKGNFKDGQFLDGAVEFIYKKPII